MDDLLKMIKDAFAAVPYPGDDNIRNSNQGDEPYLLEAEFAGKDDWMTLDPQFIDHAPGGFASALSFFSRDAFRFYLPAYLLADLKGQLQYTEVVFHLTFGLTDATKDRLIHPHYEQSTIWFEYQSDRHSVFTPEEAAAIVAYLKYKQMQMNNDFEWYEQDEITQALHNFWEAAAQLEDGG